MPTVIGRGLGRSFATGRPALAEVSFTLPTGTGLALIGPSGAGKSTLLRLLAGLDAPSAGQIHFDTQDVTAWPPHRRDVGWLPQRAVLYPHLNVRDNLLVGLHLQRPAWWRRGPEWSPAALNARAAECAERLGLSALLTRRSSELSGGERQRVALGRALLRGPALWLLDEPFSALDPPLRATVRTQVLAWQRACGATLVLATHDPADVALLTEQVAVLDAGRLVQIGTRATVQQQPANAFAAFLGNSTRENE